MSETFEGRALRDLRCIYDLRMAAPSGVRSKLFCVHTEARHDTEHLVSVIGRTQDGDSTDA